MNARHSRQRHENSFHSGHFRSRHVARNGDTASLEACATSGTYDIREAELRRALYGSTAMWTVLLRVPSLNSMITGVRGLFPRVSGIGTFTW